MKRSTLATSVKEIYFWYSDAYEPNILKEQERLKEQDGTESVTIYYLEGTGHVDDYERWKSALLNRTQTFKRKGFVFNDDNIRSLVPTGFIVFIRKATL